MSGPGIEQKRKRAVDELQAAIRELTRHAHGRDLSNADKVAQYRQAVKNLSRVSERSCG